MSSNESDSSDREKSSSLMRSNNDQGRRAKWENLWKNTLKEKDLRVAVNLQTIEALMKKEVPHRKSDQKIWRNDIDLEARKAKGKRIEDIHLRYHHQAPLTKILIRLNIETMRAPKAQSPDLGWFLSRTSENTDYL